MIPPLVRIPALVAVCLGVAYKPAAPQVGGGSSAPAFVHEAWTVADGLPVNSVNATLQSRAGYLWIATFDGLVRFDGVRFTVFTTANAPGLPSNRITHLREAGDGGLWLRTEQNHLVRWHAGVFTHFAEAQGLPDRSTRALLLDPDGTVWVGTDHGVHRLEGGRFVPVARHAIRGEVAVLLRDSAGSLWVGMRHAGLYRVRGSEVTHLGAASGLRGSWVTGLAQDRVGDVWIGTSAGLYRYHAGRIERPRFASGDSLSWHTERLWTDRARAEVWVAGEEGLYVARGGRHVRTVLETPGRAAQIQVLFDTLGVAWYSTDDRIYRDGRLVFEVPMRDVREPRPTGQVHNLTWDREGSLWVGTHSSGLYRLKPSLFRVYGDAEGIAYRNVATVLEDRAGVLWIGTQGRGLSRLSGGNVASYIPEQGLPAFIYALLQDREGDLWAGTLRLGILHCRLPGMTCGVPPGGQPAPDATVYALHQDAAGDVWAGTDKGLFRLRHGRWEQMGQRAGLDPSPVRVFLETPDGALWIGSDGGGLARYLEGRFLRITSADGLPSDLIRSLYQDADGWLWVGTGGHGVARVDPRGWADGRHGGRIVHYQKQDGLYDEVIHQILEDDYGRLWMSSNRGVFWVTRAELLAFAEGTASRVNSTAYTERDGLRNREANGGMHPAGVTASDGRLWFPTQDGVAVVDPAHIRRNLLPPPVVVERLATRERAFPAADTLLVLQAGERDFEIEYTALSLLAPENVRFRYRLEGLTDEWTEAAGRRVAFYTNVPPGRYTFRVIASNNDGVWNEEGATLELRVPPYFHETRTALVLLLLGMGVLGAGGVRWRFRNLHRRERELAQLVAARTAALRRNERQLEEQNAELAALHEARSRLFANLSHEFRTPLTLILGPLRSVLAGRHGTLAPSLREQAELMLRNSQRLLRLIDQVLDLTRIQAGQLTLERRSHDLVGVARSVTLAFAPLAERRGIALTFRAEQPDLTLAFDAEQLEKVLLNLLSNALKFTPAGGGVEVTVAAADGAASIAVRDTGRGIAPDELPRLFERFFQADSSATRRYEGTGIGLALAKEIVVLHGGEIGVESTPGAGSTFTVRLPLVVAVEATPASSAVVRVPRIAAAADTLAAMLPTPDERRPEGETEEQDRTTVLIVDDNADVRAFLRSVLASSYRVLEAADGRAGLERARSELPDLIVADVMMPELDGLALGRALKDDAMTDAIPLVLLTARAAPEDQIAGFDTGADAYLVKPFDPGVLEARLAGLLAQRHRLRERFRIGEEVPPAPAPAARSELEQRLHALVEAKLTEPGFDAYALAAAAGLSYQQLYRALRAELGVTPSRFIRAVRVECAAELLRQGAGSVTEIGYSVGFESLSYFRRAFRERFGTNPSDHLAARTGTPHA